jgi:aminopeptidase N
LKRIAASALVAVLLAGCATAPMGTAPVIAPRPLAEAVPSDLPRSARPSHYAITIQPDAKALTFSGSSTVELEVFADSPALVLHAVELDISRATLTLLAGGTAMPVQIALDEAAQTATFSTGQPIAAGRYRLETSYTGKINTQAMGLFALDYPDKRTGEDRRGLFTQFEAPDARRFAPMFDEPSYKATFDLTAIVPDGQMALSNMPVVTEDRLGDGTKRVRFATSPRMSSYLLFFGLGDFERMAMKGPNGVDLGIVAPIGSGEQSRFALESLPPVMGWFGDYFGVPYPLPKLDNIAGPGQSQFFGAMENWGAIFTFERILLTDPAITSAAAQQQIYSTQNHEVAHQWFGNIVTMAWWDDLWLNEGFASWMETKVTDHFKPEWHALLGRVAGREAAMNLDSFATTHPVVQPIRTVAETAQAFDAIAYQKGEAVIAMLEAYAGEDTWRQGIRTYIERHQYQNTVSDDLWRAVEEAGATGLTEIAHDFTRQPGIPLVRAEASCANGTTTLKLVQSEFSRDRMDQVAASPQAWRVPLLIQAGTGAPQRHVLEGSASLKVPGCGAVVVNGGQLGYFRTLYTPAMNRANAGALPRLAPTDQLGLLRDGFALAQAGYQPLAPALELLEAVPADANPVVAEGAVNRWNAMYGVLVDDAPKAQLADLARTRWLPRLQVLGFDPKPADQVVDANLRAALIGALGDMGDTTVAEEARTRFARLASDPRALDGPLKTTWLNIAARNATAAEWDLLVRLAAESRSAVERQAYFTQLGRVTNEALARRALDFSLTGEAGTTSAAIITAVAGNFPEMAFDFVLANRTQVDALVDSSGRANFIARLGAASKDAGMLTKLADFRATLPEDQRRPVDQVIASLRQRLDSEPRQRSELAAWLAAK